MLFRPLGAFVARFWPLLLPVWLLVFLAASVFAPSWQSVLIDGEFAFLPENQPSRVGERIFARSFSRNFFGSSVIVVVRRDSRPEGLITDPDHPMRDDRTFVEEILSPRLRQLALQNGWISAGDAVPLANGSIPLISKISTFSEPQLGRLLDSRDKKATLVHIALTTEYLDQRNAPLIVAVRNLTDPAKGELRREGLIPPGLDLYLSGPAVVGHDMQKAAEQSGAATEYATVTLVVVLLLLIYRAPLLALIPLVTVFLGVKLALYVLALLARVGAIELFNGVEVYVTVVMYGAGVDYCMFLMARYKEELDAGSGSADAIADAIGNVGPALAASAGTTMVGIGMMVFAEFGKFRQAGVAMSVSLIFVLLASLTFAPALLRLCGRSAFWPRTMPDGTGMTSGWISPTSGLSRVLGSRNLRNFWDRVATQITRRPGRWWFFSVVAMLPFAAIGVAYHDHLTYGLLDELPEDTLSVEGARAVQDHFPAGEAGPVTVLVAHEGMRFADARGEAAITNLTRRLWERADELEIADLRSQSAPAGVVSQQDLSLVERRWMTRFAASTSRYYVSDTGPDAGRLTRLDVIFDADPFSRDSLDRLNRLQQAVRESLPQELSGAELHYIGPTASIRDLKSVTQNDQLRIDILVLLGVFAVLIALLRRPAIAAYLIATVFVSYLVTLGATVLIFWAWNDLVLDTPGGFAGLDWKVPVFLFTILVAVGEDYNIYLVTRVEEEQKRLGGIAGVTAGLARTGGIISSCGLIMAGTFASLMFGSLAGMVQLGFALAFGVILDTFIVRPILVPAYLILLNQGYFGSQMSRWLGAYDSDEAEPMRSR